MSARKNSPPAVPTLKTEEKPETVLESLDRVLAAMDLAALLAQCDQLRQSGQRAAIVPLYQRWLAKTQSPVRHVAWFNLGVELSDRADPIGAEQAYLQALALKPDLIEAQFNLGNTLEAQGRVNETIALWRTALERLDAQSITSVSMTVMLLNNLGRLLEILKQYYDAEKYLERSLAIQPGQPDVLQHWVHLRQKQCTWPAEESLPRVPKHAMRMAVSPLAMLAAQDDPAMQVLTARNFVARKFGTLKTGNLGAARIRRPRERLRIAYLSGDLCTHAVGLLLPDFLESHDRTKVEVFGYCWSPEDGSPLRQRLISAFEHFERIEQLDDETAAARIAAAGIDILIDLHGLSAGVRPGILALKPAPIAVTWLGFIGPTAMPWIDYVIGDRFTLTDDLEPYYSERMIRLNGCFLPGDRKRQIGKAATREECGLPEKAFVFATFNNAYKLNPVMWDCWMRILRQVPDSVLWVVDDNVWATEHLREAALASGIDSARLVFNPRTSHADFLGRLPLADLFLDNHPYNAGSTASDALWMGLPILTLAGQTFVSRMGGSLLTAIGVPELIAYDLGDYERKAVALAKSQQELDRLREKLSRARHGSQAFNMKSLARQIEAMFLTIAKPIVGDLDKTVSGT
jgi:predicted O-linked N-acetylglucosamine transferase (SPINDLY family)